LIRHQDDFNSFFAASAAVWVPLAHPGMPPIATPARSTSPAEENGDAGARVNPAEPPTRALDMDPAGRDSSPQPSGVAHLSPPSRSPGKLHASATPKKSPDLVAFKSIKKSSPLKHVTPILRKYSAQRKAKTAKKTFSLSKVNLFKKYFFFNDFNFLQILGCHQNPQNFKK
jgi:hypothetical protein